MQLLCNSSHGHLGELKHFLLENTPTYASTLSWNRDILLSFGQIIYNKVQVLVVEQILSLFFRSNLTVLFLVSVCSVVALKGEKKQVRAYQLEHITTLQAIRLPA